MHAAAHVCVSFYALGKRQCPRLEGKSKEVSRPVPQESQGDIIDLDVLRDRVQSLGFEPIGIYVDICIGRIRVTY